MLAALHSVPGVCLSAGGVDRAEILRPSQCFLALFSSENKCEHALKRAGSVGRAHVSVRKRWGRVCAYFICHSTTGDATGDGSRRKQKLALQVSQGTNHVLSSMRGEITPRKVILRASACGRRTLGSAHYSIKSYGERALLVVVVVLLLAHFRQQAQYCCRRPSYSRPRTHRSHHFAPRPSRQIAGTVTRTRPHPKRRSRE